MHSLLLCTPAAFHLKLPQTSACGLSLTAGTTNELTTAQGRSELPRKWANHSPGKIRDWGLGDNPAPQASRAPS